jgi:hypothetical protein
MHLFELDSGVPSETQTSLKLIISRTNPLNSPANTLIFIFQCTSAVFARSLQVLLLPYFIAWSPALSIIENTLQVSFSVNNQIITDEVMLDIKIGIKIEQIKKNFFMDFLESLKIRLQCENLSEILELAGLNGVKIESSSINVSLDPEDIPQNIANYFQELSEGVVKYFEVVEAIRPFLKNSEVSILGNIAGLNIQGSLIY